MKWFTASLNFNSYIFIKSSEKQRTSMVQNQDFFLINNYSEQSVLILCYYIAQLNKYNRVFIFIFFCSQVHLISKMYIKEQKDEIDIYW